MKPDKEDRIAGYLRQLNMGMLFDELSDTYLERSGTRDMIGGIPVPVNPDENGELSTLTIALNMARVIGGDTDYPYCRQYKEYISHITNDNPVPLLISEGAREADKGNMEVACMFFRSALSFEPESRDALYLYGRSCKESYEQEDLDEAYVGNFKAESLEAFELLTMLHPDFDMGYYFLGYGYTNLGLYTKAQITWNTFLKLSENAELREEIGERLESLTSPVIIEQGCNKVLSGDFAGGKAVLEPFMTGNYESWWPLWYYLGVAEESLGNPEEAIERFKKALVYSPSNTEIMQDLVNLYRATGDKINEEKYLKKIEIIKQNLEDESGNN